MTISRDSNVLMRSRMISKTVWEHEFHPDMDEFDRLSSVVDFSMRHASCRRSDNQNLKKPGDDYYEWDEIIEAGKSYMVGDSVPTDDFLKSHASYLPKNGWMAMAVEYAFNNPDKRIIVETYGRNPRYYEVYKRGDYVEIALPHHDQGGEKHWAVHKNNPRKRILINVD